MAQIARGQTSEAASPWLEVFTSIGSSFVDPAALEFAIDDISSEALEAEPVQVFPADGFEPVDLVGDRLDLGHFAANWTPELDEALGKHRIRWRAKLDAGEADWSEWLAVFEVVEVEAISEPFEGYSSVARMRGEGLPVGRADDDRVSDLIEEASRDIDSICGWFFSPRAKEIRLDGKGRRGGKTLPLPAPPIRIDEVLVDGFPLESDVDFFVSGACPSEGEKPFPALERDRLVGYWPEGQRNITIRGIFGYTEADGTVFGRTPRAIRRACEIMVLRGARPLDDDSDERWRGRLISQKTNRQSITLSAFPSRDMAWDQDPEVSRILARYRRPSSVRVA